MEEKKGEEEPTDERYKNLDPRVSSFSTCLILYLDGWTYRKWDHG